MSFRERVAIVESQVQRACEEHGVVAVWHAWLRSRADIPDDQALASVGIDKPYVTDTGPLIRLHERLPKEYLDKEFIVFYINEETLETRHLFISGTQNSFAFNECFTPEDQRLGWKAIMSTRAFEYSPQKIEAHHQEHVASLKRYWTEFLKDMESVRVIDNGVHYTAHPSETGTGFHGQQFLVHWIDSTLAPSVCNLSYQGKVPVWMKDQMPDNAIIATM